LKSITPPDKEFQEREPNANGFSIRVQPSGTVTFYYFYTADGKKKKVCLGDYPGLSLANARELASIVHNRRLKGEWPLIPEAAPPPPPKYTLQDLWDHYYKRRSNDCRLKAESLGLVYTTNDNLEGQRRYMEKDVLPLWGHLAVDAVSRGDINELLEDIADPAGERNAPHGARNVAKVLREVYNFGISTGKYGLESSPCFKLRPPGRANVSERTLGPHEIQHFWRILNDSRINPSIVAALKVLLLTGQRPSMVAKMEWSELDGHWWEMPPARTQKNECPQRVYLVPTAMELLELEDTRRWLFPLQSDTNRSIIRTDLQRAVYRICHGKRWPYPSFCPNDLRRTVSTQMQAMGINLEVRAAIKHHVALGARRHYDKYQFDKEKQQALLDWEARLQKILVTGE